MFNEGGNEGFWRFQLRDKHGRWVKMHGAVSFDFTMPGQKGTFKAHGTFEGNMRQGFSQIKVGPGQKIAPGLYEVDSRYIESVKAILPGANDNSSSPKKHTKYNLSGYREASNSVSDLKLGDVVEQQDTGIQGVVSKISANSSDKTSSDISIMWADGSSNDMALPNSQKIKSWRKEASNPPPASSKPKPKDWTTDSDWNTRARSEYNENRNIINGDSNASTDFVPGNNLFSGFEGSTLKTIPSKDPNRNYDIETTRHKDLTIVDYRGRKMVLANINGVQVPFYLSTGQGGKADVQSGKWYPFFGIDDGTGWINKASGKYINNYYGSPELRAQSEWLDKNIGNIMNDTTHPVIASNDMNKFLDLVNADTHPIPNDKAILGNDKMDDLIKANIADIVRRVRKKKPLTK